MNRTFTISSQPYLDTYNKCYSTIITLNCIPEGPIRNLIRNLTLNKLSPFKQSSACYPNQNCGLGLRTFRNKCNLIMTVDELPELISFLLNNGYIIDTKITKMLYDSDIQISDEKKLIAFVTYSRIK